MSQHSWPSFSSHPISVSYPQIQFLVLKIFGKKQRRLSYNFLVREVNPKDETFNQASPIPGASSYFLITKCSLWISRSFISFLRSLFWDFSPMGQYLASYYCRYESLSSHQNFGSYFFIFGKCGVTQHRLYRDSLTLISLIPRGISGKCVFLCNNNWVKKQPPVVISKKRFLKYFTNFTRKHL